MTRLAGAFSADPPAAAPRGGCSGCAASDCHLPADAAEGSLFPPHVTFFFPSGALLALCICATAPTTLRTAPHRCFPAVL